MKALCIKNTANPSILILPKDLGCDISDDNFIVSCDYYTVDSHTNGYNITVHRQYNVYGVLIYQDNIRLLIADDDNIPRFFPYELFELTDNNIEYDWEFGKYQIGKSILTLIGYHEIATDYKELTDLICPTLTYSSKNAIKTFLYYKHRQDQ